VAAVKVRDSGNPVRPLDIFQKGAQINAPPHYHAGPDASFDKVFHKQDALAADACIAYLLPLMATVRLF
jgi:hypothetical protein